MSKEALMKAIELAEGPGALATAIRSQVPASKVSRAHIYKWLNTCQAPVPPAEYVLPICRALAWKVTPHELRGDLYPHAGDALPVEAQPVSEAAA